MSSVMGPRTIFSGVPPDVTLDNDLAGLPRWSYGAGAAAGAGAGAEIFDGD